MQEHIALLKRLPVCHGKMEFIREEIRKKEAGVRGENRMLLKLSELRIPGTFYVFSDVPLILGEWKVQIDCLVVTDRCCIVIESKNISGDLYFDENSDDFYKVNPDGNEISYPNPYYQLMRNIRFMKEFLRDIFPEMKVTGCVIMTAKSCRIREKPAYYPIFKLESMIERVLQIYNNSSPLQLLESQFSGIQEKIMRMQSTFTYPPLCEYYKIPPQEILTGVECPNCGTLGMKRTGKTWTCIACQKKSRDAHKYAVDEFFCLIDNKMKNKDFRQFCQIDSIYAASRMLNNLNLQSHKAGAWTFYTKKKDR